MKKLLVILMAVVMTWGLVACGGTDTSSDIEDEITTEAVETEEATEADKSGQDSDFRAFMDEYEEFVDDYVAFMKKYNESDDTASMLVDYTKMMGDYAEMTSKLNEIDDDELSDEDALYYLEVINRCNEKMLKAM